MKITVEYLQELKKLGDTFNQTPSMGLYTFPRQNLRFIFFYN